MKRTVIESGDQNGWLCLGLGVCVCESVWVMPIRIRFASYIFLWLWARGILQTVRNEGSSLRISIQCYFTGVLSFYVCVCVRECCKLFSVIVIHFLVRVVVNSFPVLHGTSLQTDSWRHLVYLDLCFGPRFKIEFFIRKTSIQYIYIGIIYVDLS